jgi:GNAT superfamily N-acetyltransferase
MSAIEDNKLGKRGPDYEYTSFPVYSIASGIYPVVKGYLPDEVGMPTFLFPSMVWFTVFNDKGEWIAYSAAQLNKDGCYFGPTFVKEEWRCRGLQGLLLQVKEEFAHSLGYKEVVSSAYLNNKISIRNMLRAGFVEVKRTEDSIYLKKGLSQ